MAGYAARNHMRRTGPCGARDADATRARKDDARTVREDRGTLDRRRARLASPVRHGVKEEAEKPAQGPEGPGTRDRAAQRPDRKKA